MDLPAARVYVAPVQRVAERAAPDANVVHAAARAGIGGSGGALPHLDRIQRLFGRHDVSKITAHVGGPAAEATQAMGAQAYATGDHVAFRLAPDLHTAAHEAAHIVQQRGGVQLKGGVGAVGDSYERHADAVADKVVRGESAEELLDQMSDGEATGSAVQLLATSGGEFDVANYAPYSSGRLRGASIEITFTPNELVIAPKLGLTQTIRSSKGGAPHYLGSAHESAERRARSNTAAQGDEGRQIDRLPAKTNPMYGIDNPPVGTGLGGTSTSAAGNARFGHRTVDPVSGAVDMQSAWMSDRPKLVWTAGTAMEQIFETTALVVEGPMSGTDLGSVEWGVQTAADTGVATTMPFRVVSQGVPTQAFMVAATNWNAQTIAMPGRIVAPGPGTVDSREALVAGTRYPANTLVMTLKTAAGFAQVRTSVDAMFDRFLVAAGATVIAGQQLAVYRTQEETVDLPTTDHLTADPAKLSDAELEGRMRLLSDEIQGMDKASAGYQNKRFEIRALGRAAAARGHDAVDSGLRYSVANGDTLRGIARDYLGDENQWTGIVVLNASQLLDPYQIQAGAALTMPRPFTGKRVREESSSESSKKSQDDKRPSKRQKTTNQDSM
jgi:hypothetical protein